MRPVPWLWAYFLGVLVGLWRIDAPPVQRIGLALVWPVAILACLVTLTMLSISAAVLFPLIGIAALAAGGAAWMIWG
jgi:hypothetical protein